MVGHERALRRGGEGGLARLTEHSNVPDLLDRKAFEAWLAKQRREVCVAIATRAAMRVLPGLARLSSMGSISPVECVTQILPTFRCLAVAWCAAKYLDNSLLLQRAAGIASKDVADQPSAKDVSAASLAAYAAASGGATAVNAAAAAFRAADAAFVAAAASRATDAAYRAAVIDVRSVANNSEDTKWIDGPLWPMGEPDWSKVFWADLKSALPTDEYWDVWTRWWEARRDGLPANKEFELFRATRDEEFWKRSPRQINEAIAAEEERLITLAAA